MGIVGQLANPTRFLWISGKILPVAWLAAILLVGAGLYYAFPGSPPDSRMGETVRMMYVHVPAAWLAMLTYGMMAVAALGTLVWRHPLADVFVKSAAPLGAAFTFLGLVTGALWGQPTWGRAFPLDARVISFMILLLVYLGLIAVRWTMADPGRASRVVAVLTLVGAVNLPIIHYSVVWWESTHQPPSVLASYVPSPMVNQAELTAEQLADLQAGLWYVNITTDQNPDGEVRGQIVPAPGADAAAPTAFVTTLTNAAGAERGAGTLAYAPDTMTLSWNVAFFDLSGLARDANFHGPAAVGEEGDGIFQVANGQPALPSAFATPLFFMLGGYTFMFVGLVLVAMRTEIFGRRLRSMQLSAVGAEA